MVRKRWRGVAPYFYTVWPLLCIIPHLARSRPEMPARAMQISPPLKTRTYQAFRRSDEWWTTPGDPPRDSLSWLLSSFPWGGRVLAGTTRRTNRANIFSPRLRFYDARDINTCISISFLSFKNCIYLPSLNTQAYLCRNLGIKYIYKRMSSSF